MSVTDAASADRAYGFDDSLIQRAVTMATPEAQITELLQNPRQLKRRPNRRRPYRPAA